MLKDEYQHKLDGKRNFVPLRGVKAYVQVSSIVRIFVSHYLNTTLNQRFSLL